MPRYPTYRFTAQLWVHTGANPWYFLTLPEDCSDDIEMRVPSAGRGFGSAKVRVTVGTARWETSVFPDAKRGAYVLPVKKAVREGQGLMAGRPVDVVLELTDPLAVH